MFQLVRRLSHFLGNMDAKTITSLLVSFVLVSFVVFMFLFGQEWLNMDQEGQLGRLLMAAERSPWAVVGVISIFSLLALTGFPQILLITATVMAFGPWNGAIYSWVGTMASATLTFGIGHFLGGRWVRRYGADRVQSLIDFLGRHGIVSSAMIRVVPSAPFIVVNAAAGAAHIPLWKYWLGTGLGIVPKIALVATLGVFTPSPAMFQDGVDGILDFFTSREPSQFALVAGIIVLWLVFLLAIRIVYGRMRRREETTDEE